MRSTARAVLALLAMAAVSLGLMGASGAQDGPSIELDPESIAEAGTTDVTVNGSGFSIDVFVLNCPGAGGSIDALVEGDVTLLCDLGNLLTGSPDADGNFSVTFTDLEITDCGLVFVAGDLDQTEVGGPVVLTVDNPAEGVECEVVEGAGYEITEGGSVLAAAAAAGDTSIEVEDESQFGVGDGITICPGCPNEESNGVSGFGSIVLDSPLEFDHEAGEEVVVSAADELATTGTSTALVVLIASAVVIFGGLMAREARRLTDAGSR